MKINSLVLLFCIVVLSAFAKLRPNRLSDELSGEPDFEDESTEIPGIITDVEFPDTPTEFESQESTIPAQTEPEVDPPIVVHVPGEVHPEVLNSLVDNTSNEKAYIEVIDATFNHEVLEHDGPVAMLVYNSNNCKYSNRALRSFTEAAKNLKGVIKTVVVEGMVNNRIRLMYQIQGFPHMKLFGVDHNHPIKYQGAHKNASYVSVLTTFVEKTEAEKIDIAARKLIPVVEENEDDYEL